jgi:hypothetical protein
MIHTDVLRRAVPWAQLILESGHLPNDLNLRRGQRLSALFTGFAVAFLVASLAEPKLLFGAAASILVVLVLNRDWFSFLRRREGIRFVVASVPLHLLYLLYSGLSYAFVWISFRLKRVFPANAARREKASAGSAP